MGTYRSVRFDFYPLEADADANKAYGVLEECEQELGYGGEITCWLGCWGESTKWYHGSDVAKRISDSCPTVAVRLREASASFGVRDTVYLTGQVPLNGDRVFGIFGTGGLKTLKKRIIKFSNQALAKQKKEQAAKLAREEAKKKALAKIKELQQQAVNKLTPEERGALGV